MGTFFKIHPIRVWCAGEMAKDPSLGWEQLWDQSVEARQISATWFKTRNRSARDLRLRIRFEQDAFTRMTLSGSVLDFLSTGWFRLSQPPLEALETGLEALAQLMGILLNDGVMKRRSVWAVCNRHTHPTKPLWAPCHRKEPV
jgi:hypothetical protein